ncbi:hypothetical protein [Flavobacterium ginsenosidimutans]|uniref:Tetratricopeptide repeat protein n=1 Tax=Flavobacterium ginsenosidimutans TaxID=687844 RepID=A0ABZ2Q8T8_9FLAO
MIDWYRKKSWTKEDEEHFFAKLSRARKDGRAQYLKIQAIELVETKEPKLLNVAKELLEKILDEYPNDNFNKSSVYNTLGDIFLLENTTEKAIEYYKKSIDFEKVYPNVKTDSYLIYSELIIKNQLSHEYLSVEKLLEETISDLLFPIDKYKVFSILAILNYYNSKKEIAKEYAELANENAQAETSGLRYHKYLGIVSQRDKFFDDYIAKL